MSNSNFGNLFTSFIGTFRAVGRTVVDENLSKVWGVNNVIHKKVVMIQKENQITTKGLASKTKMKATLKLKLHPNFSWQVLAKETLKARDEEKIRKEGEAFCKQVFSELVSFESKRHESIVFH